MDSDDTSCHGYYIIRFYSSPYTFQKYLNIYGQVTSSGEIVCKGTNFYPIPINYYYYVFPSNKENNTMIS